MREFLVRALAEEEKQQQKRQQIAAVEIAEVQPREQAVEQIHLRCAPRRRWIPRRWRRREAAYPAPAGRRCAVRDGSGWATRV